MWTSNLPPIIRESQVADTVLPGPVFTLSLGSQHPKSPLRQGKQKWTSLIWTLTLAIGYTI